MTNDISQWLQNGADYSVGIGLFEKYCDNSFLLKLFKRSETSYNRTKMIELLSAVESKEPEPQPEICRNSENSNYSENSNPAEKTETEQNPIIPEIPEVFTVKKQLDKSYTDLRGLHALMFTMPEGEELRKLAIMVTRTGRQNAELWERLRFIQENGVDPLAQEPPPPPVMIDLHLLEKKEAIRKSLVKAKGTAKKQNPPKAKTLALIEQRTKELAEINQLIENIKKGASGES